jgi:hypothetical protein
MDKVWLPIPARILDTHAAQYALCARVLAKGAQRLDLGARQMGKNKGTQLVADEVRMRYSASFLFVVAEEECCNLLHARHWLFRLSFLYNGDGYFA